MSFWDRIIPWRRGVRTDETAVVRTDGWVSALTGFGVAGMDKRLGTQFRLNVVNSQEAKNLWRSNDIAARIVEKIPGESLRTGYTVQMDDKEMAEAVMNKLTQLETNMRFVDAMSKERAFGGAAILPVMRDDQPSLALPLNENRVMDLSHLIVFEPRELTPQTFYTNPLEPNFGEPRTYWVNPIARGGISSGAGTIIHESRLIVFPGIRVSRDQVSAEDWGDSALQRPHEVLRDFGVSWSAVGVMLTDFAQAVMTFKGLAELIANDKDEVIQNRLKAVELSRSTIRATLLDADESYERKQTPVSGLAELLDRFESRLAAAADMPITILMGRSPAGLNATGESDIRLFYDRVKSFQNLKLDPRLRQLTKYVMLDRSGPTGGFVPDTWSIVYNPLWMPSEKEAAETRKIVADTDEIYFSISAVSSQEIRTSRWGGDTYSAEMTIDADQSVFVDDSEDGDEVEIDLGGGVELELNENEIGEESVSADEISIKVEEVDTDNNPDTPPEEFVVIKVREHERRIKLKPRSDAELTAEARGELTASDFAVPDGRKLPINDPPHVRAAMSRFSQTIFSSKAQRKEAFDRIVARAESLEIDSAGFQEQWQGRLDAMRLDDIVKSGSKYLVMSKDGDLLGEHDTLEEAEAQLRAVEASKRG